MPLNSTAEAIKLSAADRLKLRNFDDLALAEVKSSGERIIIKDQDVNVPTALSLNGRLFVSPRDHLDALVSFKSNFLFPFIKKNFDKLTKNFFRQSCLSKNNRRNAKKTTLNHLVLKN